MGIFQSKIRFDQGFGVIGEKAFDGPLRAKHGILLSDDPKNNVFARVFTLRQDGTNKVQAGGEGTFWGILVNPKAFANISRVGDTSPNYLPNETIGEFAGMGEFFARSINGAPLGGYNVFYNIETGEIRTDPDTLTEPVAGYLPVPNSSIVRVSNPANSGGQDADGNSIFVLRLTN